MLNITIEEYFSIYETMLKIRTFDETALMLAESGELNGFVHAYSGQEAIATGVCSELTKEDCIVSHHRGHGHIIAKGADIRRMFAELYGKAPGYSGGRSGSMHIADVSRGIIGANGIVGAGLPIANGVAFALDYIGRNAICVVFFGDGSTNRGTFHEALNLASVWELPILFVCENNGVASTTLRRETMKVERVAQRAAAYDMTGVTVDGNDPLAVKAATREAIERLYAGRGPTLLECITWRHHQHFNGDVCVYKDSREQAFWLSKEQDPISRFETFLVRERIATEKELAQTRTRIVAEVVDAVKYGKESPYPPTASMFENVYKEQ